MTSIIIPAHNEERVIGRLLDALVGTATQSFDIVVVCNGCTDDTAAVARARGGSVRVLEIGEASKRRAIEAGDASADTFPRLYVDADIELTAESARQIVEMLEAGPFLAAAPERLVPRDGCDHWVRWYYDVWERLPQVRTGLFGRGVIGLSEAGYQRVRSLPLLMGDDLAASDAFEPGERVIVEGAQVLVHPPRTVGNLYRRRVRAVTGNTQADQEAIRRPDSVTSLATLRHLGRERPRLIPKIPVFLAFALAARVGARRAIRRGDYQTWLRDESSRA